MRMSVKLAALGGILVLSAYMTPMAHAQQAKQLRVIIDPPPAAGQPHVFTPAADLVPTGNTTIARTETATLTVTCRATVDCNTVQAQLIVAGAPAITLTATVAATTASVSYSIPGKDLDDKAATLLRVQVGTPPNATTKEFSLANAATQSTPAPTTPTPTLTELLTSAACQRVPFTVSGSEFLVSPLGDVASRPRYTLTEEDRVTIVVAADARLINALHVERKSAFREVRIANIWGADAALPDVSRLITQSAGGAAPAAPTCAVREWELADFAPGQGTVDISVITKDGKQSVGTFDFRVNELFTGVFGIGAIRTTAGDPRFGTTTRAREGSPGVLDTVATMTSEAKPRMLYVLTYTPFVWGARDVTRPPNRPIERINPTVGVVLNGVAENAMAGVSMDLLSRLYVTYGVHAARVTELDPRGGVALGDVVGSRAVPTRRRWTFKPYLGVTVDLAAGANLIRTALGAATGAAQP